jgi:hypothetical protein
MERWYWNLETRDGIIAAIREALGPEASRADAERVYEYWGREEAVRLLDCPADEFLQAVNESLKE